MEIKDLSGVELNVAVGKALGHTVMFACPWWSKTSIWYIVDGEFEIDLPNYSGCWMDGGPILEAEGISVKFLSSFEGTEVSWVAQAKPSIKNPKPKMVYGSTPLEAAMRCLVIDKIGEEVTHEV
jgi:hypothetical protein